MRSRESDSRIIRSTGKFRTRQSEASFRGNLQAHYCSSSIAIYSLFQNETLIFSTHQHTYHPRLQNKAMEEYLCQFPHPSLATRAIFILLAPQQSPWHASDQVLQIRIFLPRLHISIRGQQLRAPLFELEGGDDFVILQILELPDCQVVIPCCTFQRRENNTSTIDT